jgi:prophage antirepressor-like protein
MSNLALQNKTPIKLGGRDRGFDEIQERKFEMNATAVTTKMQHALTFGAHEVKTITREGQLWMSSEEIGSALEYATPAISITRLYNRVADEFSPTMTKVIKVMTAGGKQAVRFFSLRGAHLLAMFARTSKAKEFRVWVLDILDKEVAEHRVSQARSVSISERQVEDLESLCIEVGFICAWWKKFEPAIELISPDLHNSTFEMFIHASLRAKGLAKEFGLKTWHKYFETYPWHATYTEKARHRERAIREG